MIEMNGTHESFDESTEFSMVQVLLHGHFREAILEQQELAETRYRVFTIVEPSASRPHYLARIRLVDGVKARHSLQDASSPEEGHLDIALPIESPHPFTPKLARDPGSNYFVSYDKGPDGEDIEVRVSPLNILSFLHAHPDFLSRSILYDVVPLRKA